MNTSKLVSASVATILAVGALAIFLPAQSGTAVREKWQTENHHAADLASLPVSTARGLRNPDAAGSAGLVQEDRVAYVRRASPSP